MAALASVTGSAAFSGDGVLASVVAEQKRLDPDPPTSVDLALTFDDELWQAVHSQARLVGGRLVFDNNLVLATSKGPVQVTHLMDIQHFAVLKFGTEGAIWAIPQTDLPLLFNDPSSPAPPLVTPGAKPPSWGNKPVKFTVLMGRNASLMRGRRLFQGYSLQKRTTGDTAIIGDQTCVDESILYANVPVCYELGPFAGKRRGQIVREIALSIGIPNDKIFVPLGEIVTKPLLLSNASLLPFVAEFGLPENWFPFFDEYGNFRVIQVEMRLFPDCNVILDATKGDYELDQIEETPPSLPSTTFYTTATFPVKSNDPNAPNIVTTRTTEELVALYNPLCRANVPGASLQSDGQYRVFPSQVLMLVSRAISEVSTRDGIEFKRVVILQEMFNPLSYDPNYDVFPPTNVYTAAYGDKTFHKYMAEFVQETQRQTTDSYVDQYGTLQRQVITTMGWVAPECAIPYVTPGVGDMKSLPGQYVYPGPSARTQVEETYQVIKTVTKTYTFNPSGSLASVQEDEQAFYAPESRCDIYVTIVNNVPIVTPVPTPVIPQPPPPNPYPPPTGPPPTSPRPPVLPAAAWAATITGPTGLIQNPITRTIDCFFTITFPNAPFAALYPIILSITARDSRGALMLQRTASFQAPDKTALVHCQFPPQNVIEQNTPIATVDAVAQVFGPDISPSTNTLVFWPYPAIQQPPVGGPGPGGVRLSFTANGREVDIGPATQQVCTLTWANTSGQDAHNFQIVYQLPQRSTAFNTPPFSFVSATGGGVYDAGTNTVRWTIGTVPAGTSGTVDVTCLELPGLPPNTSILSKFSFSSTETPQVDLTVQFTEVRGWQG